MSWKLVFLSTWKSRFLCIYKKISQLKLVSVDLIGYFRHRFELGYISEKSAHFMCWCVERKFGLIKGSKTVQKKAVSHFFFDRRDIFAKHHFIIPMHSTLKMYPNFVFCIANIVIAFGDKMLDLMAFRVCVCAWKFNRHLNFGCFLSLGDLIFSWWVKVKRIIVQHDKWSSWIIWLFWHLYALIKNEHQIYHQSASNV